MRKMQRVFFENETSDIIILQETNWKEDVAEGLRKEWDGELIYNNNNVQKGRGVAFMIKRNTCDKITELYNDKEGKILIVSLEKQDKSCTICNIHAPNDAAERVVFFKLLGVFLDKWKDMFIVGDFNTVMEKEDIGDDMVYGADRGREQLKSIMARHNLVDVWREKNGGKREFSRVQVVQNKVKQSRIDLFLMKKDFMNNVLKIQYKHCTFSDHNYIKIVLDFNEIERGPGVWLLNTKVLKDSHYRKRVESMIQERVTEIELYKECIGLWWDNLKYDIKTYTIKHCREMKKQNILRESVTRREMEKELAKAAVGKGNANIIVDLEEKLKRFEEEKCQGAMVRSRANYMLEGERCTRFFYDLEKTRQKTEQIKVLKDDMGNSINKKEDILNRVFSFYQTLFTKQGIEKNASQFLLSHIKKRVNKKDRETCDGAITNKEIENALNNMKNGKSPGLDGLPCEFYKTFKLVLIPILNMVFQEVWEKGCMSPHMSRGVIKIIYKKKGDRESLENFRPISLLNCDYKILAKVLASRLKGILPKIIETNQAYAIQGRDISDTVNSVRDKIWYMAREGQQGYVLNIDFEKAFDRVEHEFLFNILKTFNFGEKFTRCLRCLYSDAKSCIKINGFLTDFMILSRSIRQGCPLSALLFTLVAEPLGLAIGADNTIKGIPVMDEHSSHSNSHSKIYQYADDTTLVIRDEDSIKNSIAIIDMYCKGSGARMNVEKTEFLRLGGGNPTRALPFKEVESAMKILGVKVGADETATTRDNWQEVIGKTKQRLAFWKRRNLTLRGKILVLNTLFLSKLWYILGSVCLPITVANDLKHLMTDFIWQGKPAKIKYDTLIGPVEEGGLGLLDPVLRMKALRVRVVKTFLAKDFREWRATMVYFFNKNLHMGSSALWMKWRDNMTFRIPEFYREVLRAWSCFSDSLVFKPEGKETILNQPLFLNSNVRPVGGIFWKTWFNAGFRKIRDLFYEVRPGLLPFQAFVDEITREQEDYAVSNIKKELEQILQAIPEEWKKTIQSNNGEEWEEGVQVLGKDGEGAFQELVLKNFYAYFKKKAFIAPTSNKYWLGMIANLKTEEIWKNIRQTLKCPLLENFDFLLGHNCISNEMRLFKIGRTTDDTCKVCQVQREGLKHMFFICEKLTCFKKKIQQILLGFGEDEKYIIRNWEKVFLFGAFKMQNKKRQALHIVMAAARHSVWVRRTTMKYKGVELDLCVLFQTKLLAILESLYVHFSDKGESDLFEKIFVLTNPFIKQSWDGIRLILPDCS